MHGGPSDHGPVGHQDSAAGRGVGPVTASRVPKQRRANEMESERGSWEYESWLVHQKGGWT